ncbi:MAG: thiamine pyrophosphate-requiring protein [Alphaproteobacteria bacterium]|nr:thiamine pyrophosphate-requiring protein [Alphaproteobacteria bacterium]
MDKSNDLAAPASVGEAFIAHLAARGVDYFFGNAGTDFPPIIEGLAKRRALGLPVPRPITVPHENTAMAMAHGYYLATGRPQAVMVHTTVGTANAVCGLMNASRQNVPILLFAGRTPITEHGQRGSRNRVIHWAQEAYDQAGMVREYVKWEYELRQVNDLHAVLDRAISIATSEPFGPIYLTLPREVLASPPGAAVNPRPLARPVRQLAPDRHLLEQAVALIAAARFPVLVTTTLGRYPEATRILSELAERFAIPVVVNWPRYVCLATDHPMHLGYSPAPILKDADVVIVVDCDVPWAIPPETPPSDARVIHIATDPLFQDYPMRTFASDLTIASSPAIALQAIASGLAERADTFQGVVTARRRDVAERQASLIAQRQSALEKSRANRPLSPAFVSHCIDRIKGEDSILINESPLAMDHLRFSQPGQFFSAAAVGGLGWGLGAALGLKLGVPNKNVIACVGDGAYVFGNPTSAHLVSRAHDLPFLTVIFNNRMWGAVNRATKFMYPEGFAAKSNDVPLTLLEPTPDYEKVVAASDGLGIQVTEPEALLPALQQALQAVRRERRQAVVNVLTEGV